MYTFTQKQVKEVFPKEIYERGRTYYEEGRVVTLYYDEEFERWVAEVEGTELYETEIEVGNLHVGRVGLYCECPAFSTYKSCKHLVAVMLEIADQTAFYTQVTPDETDRLLENILSFKRPSPYVHVAKTQMQVEYTLRLDDWNKVWIECKTGVTHRYVIRHMREFLWNVLNDEEHFFTKKFSYDPSVHYFAKEDLDIFTLLQDIIDTGDVFTDQNVYSDQAYDRRAILVPPLIFPSLLEKLTTKETTIELAESSRHGFSIEKDKVPVQFSIGQNKREMLQLNVSGLEHTIYFPKYKMVFSNGTFYFPTSEQRYIVEQLKGLGKPTQQLPISQVSKEKLFSEVLPILKETSDIKVEREVKEDLIDVPLEAKVYLQLKEGAISCELQYNYGAYKINPFVEQEIEKDKIIIRDMQQEREVMNLIEQANFHFNGTDLYLPAHDDERVYRLLHVILPQLEEIAQIFVASDVRRLIVEDPIVPTTTVDVQEGTNLLEIGFDISGVDETEVQELLRAVIERKKFYRFKSGPLVSLETEEYEAIGDLLKDLRIKKNNITGDRITLPAYHGVQIDDEENSAFTYSASFRQLLGELKNPGERVFELPTNLQATLRPYQQTGFQWFKSLSTYHLGGILADDMGLGKTVQTIAYLLSETSELPHLVVVPSSVVYNWHNECEKFAPDLDVVVVSGTPSEREKIIEASNDKDVWITSYGALRQDIHLYRERTFEVLILDEAQYVKNYMTKTARAVRELEARKRFALSGTPIENSLDDLWSIFQIVLPNFLPSMTDFRKMNVERIATLTKPFILRRLKTDVLQELPERIETVQMSELTEEQKKLYVGYLEQLRSETSETLQENGFQKSRMKILSGITRLRQLCCHPSLFIENYGGKSGKLEELIETIKTLKASGRRMLIFSQFTAMHEIIMKELDKLKIDYFYLHGQTPAEQRVEMSHAFNNGEKDVFLISLKAGGTGLNLTGADTVILYDLWWNPAVEDQAAGRAHRYGQKNVVHVIRFITEGTIEEKMYELQQKKRELIDKVIQPGEKMLSSLSEEEVRELLNL